MENTNLEKYIENAKSKYRSFGLMAKYFPAGIKKLHSLSEVNSEIALAESRYASWGEEKFIKEMKKKNDESKEMTSIEALGNAELDAMTSLMGR